MFAYVNIYKHIPSNVCLYIYIYYIPLNQMPRCPVISILRSLAWQVLAEWHSDRQDESWADDLRPLELRGKTCSCNSCTYVWLSVYCLQCHNKDDIRRREETIRHNPRWLENLSPSNLQPKTCHPFFSGISPARWHPRVGRWLQSSTPTPWELENPRKKRVGFDHFLSGEMLVEGWTRCQITSIKKTRKPLTQSGEFFMGI